MSTRTPKAVQRLSVHGRFAFAAVALAAAFLALPPMATADTFNIANGDVAGLIAAIDTANGNGQADTINLATNGTYLLSIGAPNGEGSGLPRIYTDLTINGNNSVIQRSAGAADFRIMKIRTDNSSAQIAVTVNELTFSNGSEHNGGGLAITNGVVALNRCRVENCISTTGHGGGIYATTGIGTSLSLTLDSCSITGNVIGANADGGGLYCARFSGPVSLSVLNSTFSGNAGGGVHITNANPCVLRNCTVSGNTNRFGIYTFRAGGLRVDHCTVVNNTFGLACYESGGVGHARMTHSIIALNASQDLNSSTIFSEGHNIFGFDLFGTQINCGSPGMCSTDRAGVDPRIVPLDDNGGIGMTHMLRCDSPALDAGWPSNCLTSTDERGLPRGVDGEGDGLAACDIGAVERQLFEIQDSDDDGVDDCADLCPNTPDRKSVV